MHKAYLLPVAFSTLLTHWAWCSASGEQTRTLPVTRQEKAGVHTTYAERKRKWIHDHVEAMNKKLPGHKYTVGQEEAMKGKFSYQFPEDEQYQRAHGR
ncbi:MAG: hypothetical protein EKK48_30165 [Candidatus Melainabacteria bacterium]|nr:MAG: hypothetical protein EKK48_30165 [Candidatus Melainabacteria bacterium]